MLTRRVTIPSEPARSQRGSAAFRALTVLLQGPAFGGINPRPLPTQDSQPHSSTEMFCPPHLPLQLQWDTLSLTAVWASEGGVPRTTRTRERSQSWALNLQGLLWGKAPEAWMKRDIFPCDVLGILANVDTWPFSAVALMPRSSPSWRNPLTCLEKVSSQDLNAKLAEIRVLEDLLQRQTPSTS